MYNIPVLLNIYRNKTRVFNLISSLKAVEPKKIYLFQDGGINEEVIRGLDENLEYAKSLITWDCDIKTYRLDDDIGPAAAEYYAYKWMFSFEEMGIILEDDLIPNRSFFRYAEAMLEKFKDDHRISYVAGTDPYGVYKTDKDYFFSTRGSLYGWATWKRFIDELDPTYSWTDIPDLEKLMLSRCCDGRSYRDIIKKAEALKEKNAPDFEIMICMATVVNGQYAVIPKYNLVMNCGVDKASVNGARSLFLMPKSDQKAYYAKTYSDVSFENGSEEIAEQPGYRKIYENGFFKSLYKTASVAIRRILYGFYTLFRKK